MARTNNVDYNFRTSESITWLRFPLIFFIIMLHCFSSVRLSGNHSTYFQVIYPFSLWLGETGVPAFFFISGFLFFLSKKSYSQKLKTRFHTLFIPYILWNTSLFGLYLIAFLWGYPQDINGKSIPDFTLQDYLRIFWDRGSYDNGNFVPLLCPFWYIRNLLIMSILSPILLYIIKYVREFILFAVAIWWLFTPHNAFIPQTILFFSLGAYFSIHNKEPLEFFIRNKIFFIALFAIFSIADITVHSLYPTSINLQIHRLALIFNIPTLFLLADYCCQRDFKSKLLPNAAFIIFSVHYPITVGIRKICVAQFGGASDLIQILLYFGCVIVVTAISLLIYIFMDRYFPKVKNILSGNR